MKSFVKWDTDHIDEEYFQEDSIENESSKLLQTQTEGPPLRVAKGKNSYLDLGTPILSSIALRLRCIAKIVHPPIIVVTSK